MYIFIFGALHRPSFQSAHGGILESPFDLHDFYEVARACACVCTNNSAELFGSPLSPLWSTGQTKYTNMCTCQKGTRNNSKASYIFETTFLLYILYRYLLVCATVKNGALSKFSVEKCISWWLFCVFLLFFFFLYFCIWMYFKYPESVVCLISRGEQKYNGSSCCFFYCIANCEEMALCRSVGTLT